MRQRCTRTLRRLAALTAVLALAWVFAPSAVAGGPTSVLIVSPRSTEAAALYSTQEEYAALEKFLGSLDSSEIRTDGLKKRPLAVDSSVDSRQINVTWMAHDVRPWRVDRIHTGSATSEIWINTSSDDPVLRDGLWHRAEQPAGLRALLKKLGLMGPENSEGSSGLNFPPAWSSAQNPVATPVPAPAPAPASAAAKVRQADRPASGNDAAVWWWSIPALAAGLALGLAARPLAARLPRPPFGRGGDGTEGGPRQQLLDA
jgi:hypothetical protein